MKRHLLWFTIASDCVRLALLLAVLLLLLPRYGIFLPRWAVMLVAAVLVVESVVSYYLTRQAMAMKPAVGPESIIGAEGAAVTALKPEGYVRVHGERWLACADCPVECGTRVVVTSMSGLKLRVTAKQPQPADPA